jgi:toxin ParE1/3/4
MPLVSKSPQARLDLVEIWRYIAEESLLSADSVLMDIDEKLRMIAEFPEIGRLRNELAQDLRCFPVGKYIIFYRPVKNGIEVVRVLHGSRDIEEIL